MKELSALLTILIGRDGECLCCCSLVHALNGHSRERYDTTFSRGTLVLSIRLAIKRNFLGISPCLTVEEADILLARIERDRGLSDTENFSFLQMLGQLRDWKVWEYSFLVLSNVSHYAKTPGLANF